MVYRGQLAGGRRPVDRFTDADYRNPVFEVASRLLAPTQYAEEMPGFVEEQLIACVDRGESVYLTA